MLPEPRRPDHFARLLLIPLLVMLLVILLVFYVFFSPARVVGDSMLPTLHAEDRLLMTKGYRDAQRGDIVVFSGGTIPGSEGNLVKRVIAGEGDVVEVAGGRAVINGVPEQNLSVILDPADPEVTGPLTVPTGHVFVMGDNRPVALDSRQFGPVPLSSVAGKAVIIWAPLDRMRAF